MKTIYALVCLALVSTAFAQEGILPGEPDPNFDPKHSEGAIVSKPCPKGQTRFQKMKCGNDADPKPECKNFSPVLVCRKSAPPAPKCTKGKKPILEFRCE